MKILNSFEFRSQDAKSRKLCILLIDMQEYFLSDFVDSARYALVESQLDFLRSVRRVDLPVAVLEYKDCGNTLSELRREVDLTSVHQYITKPTNNGFHGTRLDKLLLAWNVNNLILMGINADACVLETARSAVLKDYKIWTANRLIANVSREHDAALNGTFQHWYKANGKYFSDNPSLLTSCTR
jgi:isochorismate hydrolase